MRRLDPVDPIVVVDYDPEWPARYEAEREKFLAAAGEMIMRIEHIGSTAVPYLAAKPVIDILLGVNGLEASFPVLGERLAPLGYEARRLTIREPGHPFGGGGHGLLRRKVDGRRTHHVHVYESADLDGHVDLVFRDWLRTHPDDAAAYARVKREMATVHGADREAYVDSKTAIVMEILARARAGEG